MRKKMNYLSVKITRNGIKTDAQKTEAITLTSPIL